MPRPIIKLAAAVHNWVHAERVFNKRLRVPVTFNTRSFEVFNTAMMNP